MKSFIGFALGCMALSVCAPSNAFAHGTNSIRFGLDGNKVAVIEPDWFESPLIMSKVGNSYLKDYPVDFYFPSGGNYELNYLVWQQTFLTPGLTGGNRFGPALPGYLEMFGDEPHYHVTFFCSNPGTYRFKYRGMHGIRMSDLSPVADSDEYTATFVAGGNYAAVTLDEALRLPDTPVGSPANGFAGVRISGLVALSGDSMHDYSFVQNEARTAGIMVIGSHTHFVVGDRLEIEGKLTTLNGMRAVILDNFSGVDGPAPRPLSTRLSNLAGVARSRYTTGTLGASGLGLIGRLVKVTGKIRYSFGGYAYIDDGSPVPTDGSGTTGIRISTDFHHSLISFPDEGKTITLTAVVILDNSFNGINVPVLIPRNQDDVVVHD